ncbi:MAG: hypothetical protein K0U98_14655 [Deltaproteobacteria bacterium]|nr:hypothetical protein [Deltaproteobacteria bacterium]
MPEVWIVFEQQIGEFEDAVIHESASETSVEAIVTRDLRDFAKADLTIYGPAELLAILSTTSKDSS